VGPAKESLLRNVLDLDESKAARARIVVDDEPGEASEIAALPASQRAFSDNSPAQAGTDESREYPRKMPQDRDTLRILATARRNRLQSNGRPRFDLTDEEIECSTRTAMRLADASKSQAEARAGTNTTLPA